MTLELVPDGVQARYSEALDSLVEKLKSDPYVLAAVLLGSLSHDVVWEKSDIDILIVIQETKKKLSSSFSLVEQGINIHAIITTRAEFKQMMEGAVESSFMHSLLMKGRIIFTQDETFDDLWANRQHFGARDREISLLRSSVAVLWALPKAQKWLEVKHDIHYSFFWIMKCLDSLAAVETILAGEITGREVIWQALRHNPAFFQSVYLDLIDGPKTEETLRAALNQIEGYLRERAPMLFKPVLDYLAESGGVRSVREINHYFKNQMNLEWVDGGCEWLAEQELITKVSSPTRLTEKSRVDVEEAAYYYEGGQTP